MLPGFSCCSCNIWLSWVYSLLTYCDLLMLVVKCFFLKINGNCAKMPTACINISRQSVRYLSTYFNRNWIILTLEYHGKKIDQFQLDSTLNSWECMCHELKLVFPDWLASFKKTSLTSEEASVRTDVMGEIMNMNEYENEVLLRNTFIVMMCIYLYP